ncbi:hypothetical protein LCGC14_2784050 [marine sediment metagenome]|uniref:Uncharacterized protein n=1 Tax=marine sediment metagenome TaxID=412755 RepID=A0A0F8YSI1_9ZZZZ
MTDKHTPGPWQIVYLPTGTGKSQWRVLDADAHPVSSSDVGPHAYNEANGRLIAAAPTLDTGWRTVTDAFHQMLLNRLSADEIVSRLDTLLDEHDAAIRAAKGDA